MNMFKAIASPFLGLLAVALCISMVGGLISFIATVIFIGIVLAVGSSAYDYIVSLFKSINR